MARPWRIEFEGALYHVLSRGNEQRDIYRDSEDRLSFMDSLGEMTERFEIDIFAYVLMNNHYHILLRTNRANLSKSMQWFGATYTRRFNNRHKRSGHLFQGRFKNIIVQNDAYLMQLSCYIHRNPLRAKMVKRLVVQKIIINIIVRKFKDMRKKKSDYGKIFATVYILEHMNLLIN